MLRNFYSHYISYNTNRKQHDYIHVIWPAAEKGYKTKNIIYIMPLPGKKRDKYKKKNTKYVKINGRA